MGAYSDRVIADGASHYWRLGQTGVVTALYSDLVLRDGAVHYWRLNEPSGTTAADAIGAKNGTISGGVTLNQPGPLTDVNTAMAFNGTTGKIATVATVTIPIVATIEAWIKQTGSAGAYRGYFSTRVVAAEAGELLIGVDNLVTVLYSNSSQLNGVRNVTDGAWHHLVWVVNGSTAIGYVDGVQDRSGNLNRPVGTTRLLNIGWDIAGGPGSSWPGSIDEVAIYPTALTPAQIAEHYAASTSMPVSAPDVVGGAHGTISGGVTLGQPGALAGDLDTAMTFDGATGKIATGSSFVFPLGTNTVEAWVTRSPAWVGFLKMYVAQRAGVGSVILGSLNTAIWYVSSDSGTAVEGTRNISDGVWHHVVIIFESAQSIAYVDGTLEATGPHAARPATSAPLWIGGDPGASFWWNGSIDEVAIYPRALTAPEIAAHYALATASGQNISLGLYRHLRQKTA